MITARVDFNYFLKSTKKPEKADCFCSLRRSYDKFITWLNATDLVVRAGLGTGSSGSILYLTSP
jgi:hypothetical protein